MKEATKASFTPVEIPAGRLPPWEARYEGRLRFELNDLQSSGITPEIDTDALSAGRLVLTFDWPLDKQTLRLKAVYPDSFPHMRPQVFLLSGLETPPERHCSPIEGNLCLLGRDTRQWMPRWTLCTLLKEQLRDAIKGTGEEDPQGEPAEYWWNSNQRGSGSFCLIDSAWDLGDASKGTLIFRCRKTGMMTRPSNGGTVDVPGIRGFIEEIRNSEGTILQKWDSALAPALRDAETTIPIPWVRLDEAIFPEEDLFQQIQALREKHPWLTRETPKNYKTGLSVNLFAVVYPSELAHGEYGLGWTFFYVFGHLQAFKPGNARKGRQHRLTATTLPAYRAGASDLGYRVPAVKLLRGKRILVVGTGAIGAPVAIELARNGCGILHLIEHDIVEPGNTVRWPLGAGAWGAEKLDALIDFLNREYPASTVHGHPLFLGHAGLNTDSAQNEEKTLDETIRSVDLVVDASASHGVTSLLAERTREIGVPLISLSATQSLEGGVVSRHTADGGCPMCLEYAWHNNEIETPPRRDSEDNLAQPPGCSERTFIGAGYDLQELSLQTVRLIVDTLSGENAEDSVAQILSFVDDNGVRCPPRWKVFHLPKHAGCSCRS